MDAGPPGDGGTFGCSDGEIRLQGRCYAQCTSDGDCGPREECASSGACVPSTHDGGTPDSGPPSPCDGVECTAPQVCHPLSGTCVDCNEATAGAGLGEPGHCSSLSPICDIADGSCVPVSPSQCAPCNSDDECTSTDGTFTGTCVLRAPMADIREHVCLLPCPDGTCPNGLACQMVTDEVSGNASMVCVPPVGMACTTWLDGVHGSQCLSDGDCAALGATTSVYTSACQGAVFPTDPDGGALDGAVPTPGHCRLPCGTSPDCYDQTTQQCLADGFCGAPPPVP